MKLLTRPNSLAFSGRRSWRGSWLCMSRDRADCPLQRLVMQPERSSFKLDAAAGRSLLIQDRPCLRAFARLNARVYQITEHDRTRLSASTGPRFANTMPGFRIGDRARFASLSSTRHDQPRGDAGAR